MSSFGIVDRGFAAGQKNQNALLHVFSRGEQAGRIIRDLTSTINAAGECAGASIGWTLSILAQNPPLIQVVKGAKNTAAFIKDNWSELLAVTIGWGVIISCMGLMYGFEATALPLTIGLSLGFGGGVLSGILVVMIPSVPFRGVDYEPKKFPDKNTIWSFVNTGLNKLDSNGHRAILLSVAVTVITAATGVFPTAMGVGLGFILGNHLATRIGFKQNLGPDKDSIERLEERLDAIEKEAASIRSALQEMKAGLRLGAISGMREFDLTSPYASMNYGRASIFTPTSKDT